VKTYIYPQNLRASANIWFWNLKDFAILAVALLISIVAAAQLFFIPFVLTACFGFLTIRVEERTIMDFIKYAVSYFITTQQYFEWELKR